MAVRVADYTEFEKILDAVTNDVLTIREHRDLHSGLTAALAEYQREFNQSRTFWFLTLQALSDALLHRLARLYDDRGDVASLRNLLQLVEDNRSFFSTSRFRQRMQGNAHVGDLAKLDRVPPTELVTADLDFVLKNDLVARLNTLRNKKLAHSSAAVALGYQDLGDLSWRDVDLLIERAVGIVNRYSRLFRASTAARHMVGHDDYLSLLRVVREWISWREASIQREAKGSEEDDPADSG